LWKPTLLNMYSAMLSTLPHARFRCLSPCYICVCDYVLLDRATHTIA